MRAKTDPCDSSGHSENTAKQYSLAMTALEEYWDTDKTLIFLGDGCKRYSRKEYWQKLDHVTLTPEWTSREKIEAGYKYGNELYEDVLKDLASALNTLHGVSHSVRYWRIVVGPWLLYFISAFYDHYLTLRRALEEYPEATAITMPEEEHVVPYDTNSFLRMITDDPYHVQLYSELCSHLGVRRTERATASETAPAKNRAGNPQDERRGFKTMTANLAFRIAGVAAKLRGGAALVMQDTYLGKAEFALFFRSLFRMLPYRRGYRAEPRSIATALLDPLRQKIESLLNAADSSSLRPLLNSMIARNLPVCLVESYEEVKGNALRYYPPFPRAIFSANSWYTDEWFKQWAARAAESGTLLLGGQHGGMYGINDFMSLEYHEHSLLSYFFSWGWAYRNTQISVVPMTMMLNTSNRHNALNTRKILFTVNIWPRHFFRFLPFFLSDMHQYLQTQLSFFKALTPCAKNNLKVRPHFIDYGWDVKKRWIDRFPSVEFDDISLPFRESLSQSTLFICDHSSTTMLEALALNKPTILFWNPEINYIRSEAEPYLQQLKDAGILHDSPESAARKTNAVYEHVEEWWNQPDVQRARLAFCDRFCRTSPDALSEWQKTLDNILKTKQRV